MLSALSLNSYFDWFDRQVDVSTKDRAICLSDKLSGLQLDQLSDSERRRIASAALCLRRGPQLPDFTEWGCSVDTFFNWIQDSPCDLGTQLKMLEAVVDSMTTTNKLAPVKLHWQYRPARSYDDAVAEQTVKLGKAPNRPVEKARHLSLVPPTPEQH